METFVLLWNPAKWEWPETDFQEAIVKTAEGNRHSMAWSTGTRRSGVVPGDRVYLLRQGTDRGLVAAGTFTSGIYQQEHWDGSERLAPFADIHFDRVVSPDKRLWTETLVNIAPDVRWRNLQGGGVMLPEMVAEAVEHVWGEHVESIDSAPERRPGASPARAAASSAIDSSAQKLSPVLSRPAPQPRPRSTETMEVGKIPARTYGERELRRLEDELVKRYGDHLEVQGHSVSTKRYVTEGGNSLYSDLHDDTTNTLIEAKTTSARADVRLAIGQLFDYQMHEAEHGFNPDLRALFGEPVAPDLCRLLRKHGIQYAWEESDGSFVEVLGD